MHPSSEGAQPYSGRPSQWVDHSEQMIVVDPELVAPVFFLVALGLN